MKISLMTWNTQLFEFGNKAFENKNISAEFDKLEKQKEVILAHLKKENSLAVLQEIPYKSNLTWNHHELFISLKNSFPKGSYDMIYNISSDNQIKMTIVLANKGFVEKIEGVNNNCCVSFKINGIDLDILGVHSHNALELRNWLSEKEQFRPDIMLGDFNVGNYIKHKRDKEIAANRKNFLLLMEGYIDICQGIYTYQTNKTQIDHILLENSNEFLERYLYKNVVVDNTILLSDHYPIYCEIEHK